MAPGIGGAEEGHCRRAHRGRHVQRGGVVRHERVAAPDEAGQLQEARLADDHQRRGRREAAQRLAQRPLVRPAGDNNADVARRQRVAQLRPPRQVPSLGAPASAAARMHAHQLGRASRATAAARSETPALPEVLVSGDEWAQVVKLYRLGQARPAAAGALVARSFTPPEDKVLPFGIEFIQIKPLEATKPGEREVNPPAPDGVLRMNVDSKEAAR